MPGVFITDFRTPESTAAAAAQQRADAAEQKLGEADAEAEETKSADGMSDVVSPSSATRAPAAASSASSATAGSASSAHPSTYPGGDLPTDVEDLELQLSALERNLMQLLMSNEVLYEELKSAPDDPDYLEAVAENRATILRRSERITSIKKQLAQLAPHRVEQRSEAAEQAAQAIARQQLREEQQQPQQQQQQPSPPDEGEGGLFL
jgi:hypothetical protein